MRIARARQLDPGRSILPDDALRPAKEPGAYAGAMLSSLPSIGKHAYF
jgi:hypothetical protein